jgi:hypothetical protein
MIRSHRWGSGLRICLPLALILCAASAVSGWAQDKKEIKVAPQVLWQYVGVYELAPNFKITVTVEDNQLMAQATGQAKLPVFAGSETKFFYRVVDAEIEFFKNDKGVVSHLVLYQNKQELKAPRITDKVEERKAIDVSPAILSQYVGVYELAPKVNMMITLEGNQLMVQVSGQPKAPIFASSETKFFYKVVDAQIEFFKNEKGAVSHLVLYQNQQEMKATRISDKVVERKEITVSPTILAQYVGTYELKPGFYLVVTLEGGQLMTQATGQDKVPIFAETETKFFPKVTNGEIEFLRDAKGAVTHLMLRQGPAEIDALRK